MCSLPLQHTSSFTQSMQHSVTYVPDFPGPGCDEFPFAVPFGRGQGPPGGGHGRGRG